MSNIFISSSENYLSKKYLKVGYIISNIRDKKVLFKIYKELF